MHDDAGEGQAGEWRLWAAVVLPVSPSHTRQVVDLQVRHTPLIERGACLY